MEIGCAEDTGNNYSESTQILKNLLSSSIYTKPAKLTSNSLIFNVRQCVHGIIRLNNNEAVAALTQLQ